VEALLNGLRDFGYVEGKNITIEFRWAERADQTFDLATELVRMNVGAGHAAPRLVRSAENGATKKGEGAPVSVIAG
jgi:hypothetical protein